MRHKFVGGPQDGKIHLLAVLSEDEKLKLSIPWEEYRNASQETSPDDVDMITWEWIGENTAVLPEIIVPSSQPVIEDVELEPVPTSEQITDVHAILEEANAVVTPAAHEFIQEVQSIEYPTVEAAVPQIAQDASSVDFTTFEARRKALKLPRDRFGEEVGGTKSLGWRLESGNVSKGDARKLNLGDDIGQVYVVAENLLLAYETGQRSVK